MFKKALLLSVALMASSAQASIITSGLGTDVASLGASVIGGVVVDMKGVNNAHVVSQLSASSLFEGFCDNGTPTAYNGNPCTVGIQTGFNSNVLNALGGGIVAMSIRFTLFDGDTAPNNFDEDDNTLRVNGFDFGNWSDVVTQQTDTNGNAIGATSFGFRDNILDTGWFTSFDSGVMTNIFTSLVSTGELVFQIFDVDPFDNFFDFTQGIDQSLIDVGQGPVVQPPVTGVSAPGTLAIMLLGIFGVAATRRGVR